MIEAVCRLLNEDPEGWQRQPCTEGQFLFHPLGHSIRVISNGANICVDGLWIGILDRLLIRRSLGIRSRTLVDRYLDQKVSDQLAYLDRDLLSDGV